MSLFSRIITTVFVFFVFTIEISAAQPFITTEKKSDVLVLKEKSVNLSIFTNSGIDNGILRAVKNLQSDFQKVTGTQPTILNQISGDNTPLIIIGTVGTKSVIDDLIKQKKIDGKALTGKNENSANNKMKAQSGLSPLKYFCTMLDIGWLCYYNLRTFSLN